MNNWRETLNQYDQGINWLNSLTEVNPDVRRANQEKNTFQIRQYLIDKFGKMERWLDYLGNPQAERSMIHISGTSGKGSTTTLIDAILTQLNINDTGLFTKPYVHLPLEKIRINGNMLPPSEFVQFLNEIREQHREYSKTYIDEIPKYYATWLALAHWSFNRRNVGIVSMETSVGGRFDITNINNSNLAVITTIGLDHIHILGPDIGDVAWHKAGIIKDGKPVIIGDIKNDEGLGVIIEEAHQKNAPFWVYGDDFKAENIRATEGGTIADIVTPYRTVHNLFVSLEGDYQAKNAAVAMMAALTLGNYHNYVINEQIIRDAFEKVTLPGRFEVMQRDPLVILDGAHNPQKMEGLTQTLKKNYSHKKIRLILGLLASKDAIATLSQIVPLADSIITSEPKLLNKPSFPADELATLLRGLTDKKVHIQSHAEILQAVKAGLQNIDENEILVITGSLYMIGKAREYWFPKENILYKLEHSEEANK